jgi:hypothetical protein
MYTLTSRDVLTDAEFKRRLLSFLAWGRKYCGPWFEHYVWVVDLQQRGVLHAHLLLFRRVPRGLWRRMRALWCETYGMGPGAFDVTSVRRASRAAAYLVRYVTQDRREGVRFGRNGEAYVREVFEGNAYGVSHALRFFARPITELRIAWGYGSALDAVNLRGMVAFFASAEAAHTWLSLALERVDSG